MPPLSPIRRAVARLRRTPNVDMAAEGLLDGVDGDARESRRLLLEELLADGVTVEEARTAIAEGRLAILPAQRLLAADGQRHTVADAAGAAGLEPEFLIAVWRALGRSVGDPTEPQATSEDIEAARAVARLRAAGLPDEELLEVARAMGHGMSQLSAAIRGAFQRAFGAGELSERDLGLRYAAATREMRPEMAPLLDYVLNLQHREQFGLDVVGRTQEMVPDAIPGTRFVAVGFADLVGFTGLSEAMHPSELGPIAARLDGHAKAAARAPVRLTKMVGDAAMLVSPKPEALVETAVALSAAVSRDEQLPPVRVGLAWGRALLYGGDWYGLPVNLASRVTTLAQPGRVLATEDLCEACEGDFAWSRPRSRRVRGLRDELRVAYLRGVSAPAAATVAG